MSLDSDAMLIGARQVAGYHLGNCRTCSGYEWTASRRHKERKLVPMQRCTTGLELVERWRKLWMAG